MPTTIKLKNSVTTTNAPSSLVQGEVAINITDKKVWVGNAATTPVQLLGTGATGNFSALTCTTLTASGVATFSAGTVSSPAITTTGDTNTGIFFPAADTIAFTEGGAEAMRIDSSGRLLIGTTSGTRKLTVYENAAQVDLSIVSSTTGLAVIQMGDTAADNQGQIIYRNNGDSMEFAVNGAERMRITSAGNVLVGTSTVGLENGGIQFQPNGNITSVPFIGCAGNSSSSSYISYGLYSTSLSQYQFYVDYNGTISARSTSITGLSDISEKENIKPLETGLNEVLALQPRRFDWKKGSGQNIAGFVAQEVETVLPDLVADYKVNETTTKKGLKMGDMIPTLVKAIQEQQAMIEELKAKVTALENK